MPHCHPVTLQLGVFAETEPARVAADDKRLKMKR